MMNYTKVTFFKMVKIYFQCKHCKYNAGCTAKYNPYRRIPSAADEYYWYSKCFVDMQKHEKKMNKHKKDIK